MPAHRTTVCFALATTLVAALCLGGSALAASAAGEPEGLYSATEGEGEGGGSSGFVQLSKTDATATALGTTTDLYTFFSVEVVDGLGYATGLILGAEGEDDDIYAFFTWDITTGEVLTAVPLSSAAGVITDVTALDTTTEGVFLAYIEIGGGDGPGTEWIASIDPATGAVTLLVDVDLPDDGRIFEGIATNPVTGVTYALADFDNGIPAYSPVDLVAGTVGESVALPTISDSIGAGWFVEGDFDSTGVLWFTYSNGVGVSRTDTPAEVGVSATELGDPSIAEKAITIGQTVVVPPVPVPVPEPQLAATGFPVAPVAGIAGVLLAAGALVVFGRRRSAV